jgi:hypothetical protein
MKNSKLLLIAFVLLLLVPFVKQASACDFPPKELLQEPRREFRGLYQNKSYGYSVVIPTGFVGYDVVNPFYQQGFGIVFGEQPQSYINLYAEKNSFEDGLPIDVANRQLGYLRKKGKVIESAPVAQTHLGQLQAAQVMVTYTCPGSTERYVQFSTFALSPDKGTVYEISLHTSVSRYERDRGVLERFLKSWKYTGRQMYFLNRKTFNFSRYKNFLGCDPPS